MKGVHDALAASDILAGEGIAAEVIDVRTIRPLDWPTIERSLVKTNRLIVLEEGPLTGGWAGEVLALALERAIEHIDHGSRIATPNTAVPYSPPLEDDHFPGVQRIASLIKERI
jgi:pyruvate/2-oxoglutarate/acetoin dehydrogenase E1 component